MSSLNLESVTGIVREIVSDLDMRLYDITFNDVSRILRVFIDREAGSVTIADCKKASSQISRALDSSEEIIGSYVLEVSSPGVERSLKRINHYKWAIGKLVEIDLEDKKVKGYLRKADNKEITVATDGGEQVVAYTSIVKARVVEELEYDKRK